MLKKYSTEFKLNSVYPVLKEKHSVGWLAREWGIAGTNLKLWSGLHGQYDGEV
jgi:transposase-like protein